MLVDNEEKEREKEREREREKEREREGEEGFTDNGPKEEWTHTASRELHPSACA